MAKVKLPLMSIEAHGQFADGIIFSLNVHGQYIKFCPQQKQKSTPARRAVQYAYGQISAAWRQLSQEEKDTYHAKAVINRRTNFNQFWVEKWPDYYP